MLDQIAAGLKAHFPDKLVDELLSAYQDAKHNLFLGGLRLSAVEVVASARPRCGCSNTRRPANRTALGRMLDSEKLIIALSIIHRRNSAIVFAFTFRELFASSTISGISAMLRTWQMISIEFAGCVSRRF